MPFATANATSNTLVWDDTDFVTGVAIQIMASVVNMKEAMGAILQSCAGHLGGTVNGNADALSRGATGSRPHKRRAGHR